MTTKQKRTILIGIFLILFTVIFPPWKEVVVASGKKIEFETTTYRFVLNAPPREEIKEDGQLVGLREHHIDATRMLLEWVFIGIMSGAFVSYFKDPNL